MRHPVALALALVIAPAAAVFGIGQEAMSLPMGQLVEGTVTDSTARYGFVAPTAGVLTVFVHSASDSDLILEVTDDLGQTVDDGRSDSDLFGNMGTERVSVVLRRPGVYAVTVSTYGDSAAFHVGGTWLSVDAVAVPEDPDGHPGRAIALAVGTRLEGSLDPVTGDATDWYVITAETAGVYTVITEGEDDVYLESYLDDDFSTARDRSDQDAGASGNESINIRMQAGGKAYLKVGSPLNSAAAYTIRAGVM